MLTSASALISTKLISSFSTRLPNLRNLTYQSHENDRVVESVILDEKLKQAAAVNPQDKFELVFGNHIETQFVDRMDQNEEIFIRFMNDTAFQRVVKSWMAEEAYKRLRSCEKKDGKLSLNT